MSTYHVSFTKVQAVVGNMEDYTKQLLDNLINLENDLQGSLNVWEGAAKNAYTSAQATWNSAGQIMAANAKAAHQMLDEIGSNYATQENKGGSNWSDVQGSIHR